MEVSFVQAQARLKIAQRDFKRGKCSKLQLEEAQEIFNRVNSYVSVSARSKEAQVYSMPVLPEKKDQGVPELVQLLNKANAIKKQMAALSNQLEFTEESKALAMLKELKKLNAEKESAWTNYRYFERNGILLQEEVQGTLVEEKSPELLQLEAIKASEMQKRSKARKRLQNVAISATTKQRYEEKIAKLDAEIDKLSERIKVLKHGY